MNTNTHIQQITRARDPYIPVIQIQEFTASVHVNKFATSFDIPFPCFLLGLHIVMYIPHMLCTCLNMHISNDESPNNFRRFFWKTNVESPIPSLNIRFGDSMEATILYRMQCVAVFNEFQRVWKKNEKLYN